MREWLNLADNPLFVKHVRARLRRRAIVPGVFVVFFISVCLVYIDGQIRENNNAEENFGSQTFFWLQGFLLVVVGGWQIASAVAHIKDSGILDFHRVTPMPAPVQTLGLLLGGPIREYLLFLTAMPFALYCALVGSIGVVGYCKLLLVQVTSVLMGHSIALITGLSSRSSRGASAQFVVVIVLLHMGCQTMYLSEIYGPTLLTTVPIYHEVFDKEIPKPNNRQPNPPAEANITFYGQRIPVVLQTMLFQGTVLTFFFAAASRRVRSARQPLYTKRKAIAFLGMVCLLSLGSAWRLPRIPLMLGLLYFLTMIGLILISVTTPAVGEVYKCFQRRLHTHRRNCGQWNDAAVNVPVIVFAALFVVGTAVVGLLFAPQPPAILILGNDVVTWAPCLVAGLTMLSYGFARQYFPLAYGPAWSWVFSLYVILVWVCPVGLGALLTISRVDEAPYVMGMSPLFGIVNASRVTKPMLDETVMYIATILPPALLTLTFFTLYLSQVRQVKAKAERDHQKAQAMRPVEE